MDYSAALDRVDDPISGGSGSDCSETEAWIPSLVPGFLVSTYGRVARQDGTLVGLGSARGYPAFVVTKNGSVSSYRVHVEVCRAFHGERPFKGAVVRHLDGDRQNARPENLAWGTYKENMADEVAAGKPRRGHKLTHDQVLWVRSMKGKRTGASLARELGVSDTSIYDIWSGKRWSRLQCP